MDSQAENPYASPKTLVAAGQAVALVGRIEFSGMVDRSQLRAALRTRISWSGIGTFVVISLICFTSNPRSLALPWSPRGPASGGGPMGELVGIVGVGFLLLSVWHLLLTCTHWGVDRRERAILQYSPKLYDEPTRGYLDPDHLFLDQRSGKVWLSWAAMGMCQFADDLVMVHWTKGVLGSTILTRDMFRSPDEYSQAVSVFESQMSKPYNARQQARNNAGKGSATPYLEVEATRSLRSERDWLASTEQQGNPVSAVRTLVGIPMAILRSSRPLHTFFGILVLLALIVTHQRWVVVSTLVGVWAGILVLACLLSLVQNRQLFSKRSPWFAARQTLFPQEIHLETALAYFAVPIDQFQLTAVDDQQLTIQQKGYGLSLNFARSDFLSEKAFLQARSVLSED